MPQLVDVRRRVRSASGLDRIPRPIRTATLATGAVASVLLATQTVWTLTWHQFQLDLGVYLMGAHHLTDGELYTVGLPGSLHLPFTYPPFAALIFLPLTVFGTSGAQLVWAAISLASLVVIIALSLRVLVADLDRRSTWIWAAVLSWPATLLEPVHLTFFFGQVNLVLAMLVIADLTVTVRLGRHELPRGVLIGIAAAVKLIPLVFVPYLFVSRRTRAGWTSIATFLGCTVLAACLDPRTSWSYWTFYVNDAKRVGGIAYISNQSLRGSVDRLDHRLLSGTVTSALALIVLVVGIVLARWAWSASSDFLGILVTASTGMLVSPITWAHHMVWIVPIALWLALAPDRPAWGRPWAAGAALLFWWAPIWHVPSQGAVALHERGWQLLEGNSFAAATVAFLVGVTLLLMLRSKNGRAVQDDVAPPTPSIAQTSI